MATDHHRNADANTDAETETGPAATDERTYVFSPEKAATLAVLEAVESASEIDATALPPLYDAVDPDALDALFESSDPTPTSAPRLSFSYAGLEVTVDGGPTLTVDLEESTE